MPVRYMGTKRKLAPTVRALLLAESKKGIAADLFAGVGSVAHALAPNRSVLANDMSPFAVDLGRASLLSRSPANVNVLLESVEAEFLRASRRLTTRFKGSIDREELAISGGRESLATYMSRTRHPGNDVRQRKLAQGTGAGTEIDDCTLTTRYFRASYFSTRQAIGIDALWYAIHRCDDERDIRWLKGIWLTAAATVVNAPGHTAQYLKPSSAAAYVRIKRSWARDIWSVFRNHALVSEPVGTAPWRRSNVITQLDAKDVSLSPAFEKVGVVYADPPYTKDHYSRFYHVLDTLSLYDFPASTGAGRYRHDRFSGDFSTASKVASAFDTLLLGVAEARVPFVISYPSNGLLHRQGIDLRDLIAERMNLHQIVETELQHSTMGASSGRSTKSALERLYVCRPRRRVRPSSLQGQRN
jgi:adenine-specific DNA-methyltransferase